MSKPLAIICDIDDTLCTDFNHPIRAACRVMARLHRVVRVHYVTARPEAARKGTEEFLCDQRLPGWQNLHFCPVWQSTRVHKAAVMGRLAKEYNVIVSIGDADEDEQASRAAGVPFVRITGLNTEDTWKEIAAIVERATRGIDDPLAQLFGA
jgi:hypothetical protein